MNLFDILGPVMIGPSSSHTAGASKIGFIANSLLGETPLKAEILLWGSFATTGKGHGTDIALVAGLLGMRPDDSRLPNAFELAKQAGMVFSFGIANLREAHPNTAVLLLEGTNGKKLSIRASSLGGGRINVDEIDGMAVSFGAQHNTMIINNNDAPGAIATVTGTLAQQKINIANMQVFRSGRGKQAVMVLECDEFLHNELKETLCGKNGILNVTIFNINE